jgi:anti-sigma B factor antagonist
MTDVVEPDRTASGRLLIERTADQSAVSFTIHGEIDIASVPELEREIGLAAELGPSEIVLDMGGVSFIDSTGLRLLLTIQTQAEGWQLLLRSVPEQAMRVFQLSGVLERFTIVES